jgi:hypothetical protein
MTTTREPRQMQGQLSMTGCVRRPARRSQPGWIIRLSFLAETDHEPLKECAQVIALRRHSHL